MSKNMNIKERRDTTLMKFFLDYLKGMFPNEEDAISLEEQYCKKMVKKYEDKLNDVSIYLPCNNYSKKFDEMEVYATMALDNQNGYCKCLRCGKIYSSADESERCDCKKWHYNWNTFIIGVRNSSRRFYNYVFDSFDEKNNLFYGVVVEQKLVHPFDKELIFKENVKEALSCDFQIELGDVQAFVYSVPSNLKFFELDNYKEPHFATHPKGIYAFALYNTKVIETEALVSGINHFSEIFQMPNDKSADTLETLTSFYRKWKSIRFRGIPLGCECASEATKESNEINLREIVSKIDKQYKRPVDRSLLCIEEIDQSKIKYHFYCGSCKKTHVATAKSFTDEFNQFIPFFKASNAYRMAERIKCPVCKTEKEFAARMGRNQTESSFKEFVVWYEYDKQKDALVVAKATVCNTMTTEGVKTEVIEIVCDIYKEKEKQRFVGNKEKDFSSEKTRFSKADNCFNKYRAIQSDEELYACFEHGFAAKMPMKYVWGDVEGFPEMESKGNPDKALPFLYRHPFLEILIKAKLYSLSKDIINGFSLSVLGVNEKGTDIYSILNCSKKVFKEIRNHDGNVHSFLAFKALNRADETITWEMYQSMIDKDIQTSDMIYLVERYDLKVKRVLEYLDSCYQHQCIPECEAIKIFSDYLRMAKAMNYDLSDKRIKYTNNLKKEHDIASFAYVCVKDKIQTEEFKERVNAYRHYEYGNKSFVVLAPNSPEDMIAEGKNLSHCVHSYVSLVREGNSEVLFLRKADEPEKSFYTLEVKNGKLIQIKGFSNYIPSNEKEKDVMDFVAEWAKKRNVKLHY